jgi:uncharacterized protein HemX
MRPLYGRMRAYSIEYHMRELSYTYPRSAAGIAKWESSDSKGFTAAGAIGLALLWPISILGLGLYLWVQTTPRKSQTELQIEIKEREKRIRELEVEAGIRKPGFRDRYPDLY